MTARLSMLILVYSRACPRKPHPIPQMDVEETLVPACTALHRTASRGATSPFHPPRRALWDIPRTREEKENIIGLRHACFDSRRPADYSRPTNRPNGQHPFYHFSSCTSYGVHWRGPWPGLGCGVCSQASRCNNLTFLEPRPRLSGRRRRN